MRLTEEIIQNYATPIKIIGAGGLAKVGITTSKKDGKVVAIKHIEIVEKGDDEEKKNSSVNEEGCFYQN